MPKKQPYRLIFFCSYFFYNWDVRWDLYKQLGYPKVKDLNDFEDLMVKMQKLCPKDDSGNKTYAVSLWPDWDDAMVMYVKATATAYYGYDELGCGLLPESSVGHSFTIFFINVSKSSKFLTSG